MENRLDVKNLYKSFGDLIALNDVSLSVAPGEVVAIVGPSGSGKSTLLRCINCLERVDRGSIVIDGTSLATDDPNGSVYLDDEKLRFARLKLGLVFQSFNLFPHLSVMENVTLAPMLVDEVKEDDAKEAAMALLKKVGLEKKAASYPFELSGGQQQRVAIARALAMRPDILCFDEPTSALDPELTGEVLRVIRQLASDNMTMLIVTHEMSFAAGVSHKVIFMDEANVIAQGTPDEILKNPENERIRAFLSRLNE